MSAPQLQRPAWRPQWGRVNRGVVWHVVPAAYRDLGCGPSTWCAKTTPHADLLDGLVPDNARVCPECCQNIGAFAFSVDQAWAASDRIHHHTTPTNGAGHLFVDAPNALGGRPVEDVDLLAALPEGELDAADVTDEPAAVVG